MCPPTTTMIATVLSEPYCRYVSVCLSLVLLQGIGDTTSHEMVIHSFDVPTKSDHCTLFMQVQVRQGDDMRRWVMEEGICWAGQRVGTV